MLNIDSFNFRNADSHTGESTEGGDAISFGLLGCKVCCERDEIISICSIRGGAFRITPGKNHIKDSHPTDCGHCVTLSNSSFSMEAK
jgi:hypothetical protein